MNTIDLIILGMIKSQPQSAYELQKTVEYRNISKWVKVSTPSIYKKVVQLEKQGYIHGEIVKSGKMPEKTIYQITDSGEKHFLNLMEQISGSMVKLVLDFNAVIMNLDLVSVPEKAELLDHIEAEITGLKNTVGEKRQERGHIPLTGRTILDQQFRLAAALSEWIHDFKNEYLKEDLDPLPKSQQCRK